jgi:hypothetical protein
LGQEVATIMPASHFLNDAPAIVWENARVETA